MQDIIIIGAGPAGLTAALYALRANKSVLILEKSTFGGQITYSPKVENYPGIMKVSGNELADSLVDQVLSQGAQIELETVVGIRSDGNIKVVKTEHNEYTCKSVIIATGAKHRQLGLPRENEFVGEGISFCAVCDGAFYNDKTVAVVGGGNSALQEALLLTENCKKVYIIQNLEIFTGEARLVELLKGKANVEFIMETVVTELIGESSFCGVVIENTSSKAKTKLSVDGLFVAIGLVPENNIFSDITALDRIGYIISSESCTTDAKGVFVAGDCRTKKVRQVTTATADGAIAAISACEYIDTL